MDLWHCCVHRTRSEHVRALRPAHVYVDLDVASVLLAIIHLLFRLPFDLSVCVCDIIQLLRSGQRDVQQSYFLVDLDPCTLHHRAVGTYRAAGEERVLAVGDRHRHRVGQEGDLPRRSYGSFLHYPVALPQLAEPLPALQLPLLCHHWLTGHHRRPFFYLNYFQHRNFAVYGSRVTGLGQCAAAVGLHLAAGAGDSGTAQRLTGGLHYLRLHLQLRPRV
mmetsp:Transcript_7009/g.9924  ORF Transcript_7009/g.9924 Transcript_7009/m.9924 type:complete len:219 (-) Transcript_7009:233-889(-)